MINTQRLLKKPLRFFSGMALFTALLLSLPVVWAQYPLQYPSSSQVSKDGTAILIEDYANPPLSSAMGDHAYPPPIDYKGMLARVNTLRSEPANAPLASTRFFVADMNGNLYTLDKATKKFTPYITFPEIFPKVRHGPLRLRSVGHRIRSELREKREILYRARGRSLPSLARPSRRTRTRPA